VDIFSHAVLPLALVALALRRPRAAWLAAGLGAAMPDMDVAFTWVASLADPLYAFTHRGWSHTLWGAPVWALGGLALLSRPWAARRWARLASFRLTPETCLAAVLGAWSHLALDVLTITGVPLLWPQSPARFTLNLFFYSVLLMTPVAAWLVWRLFRRRLDERTLRRGALVLVGMLLLTGALRAATMPRDLPPGAVVLPSPLEARWIVATPLPAGWHVEDRGWPPGGSGTYEGNASSAARALVPRAQQLGAYLAWSWRNPTPLVNATAIDGGWRLEFLDAVALHREATGGLLAGSFRAPRPLVVEVVGDEARVVRHPGAFG
jgi:membrane-bound metal-dependent hydrolase YbcI (DUF457 family)